MDRQPKLPEEVQKYFDCEGVPGVIITRVPHRKRIDLTKISLEQARELHTEGLLPMLKAKKAAAAVKKSDKENNGNGPGGEPHRSQHSESDSRADVQ